MPKRVIDFDAMWGSDKLAACAEWAQAEYAWLYGLADASGCFELTNPRVIWGRVAAIRRNLSIERLEQIFGEFQDKGLLFAWEHEGKRYAHWTGSDVPGRLPPPSWRMRLERLAPPVPKQALAEYVSRYSRGRAGLAGGGFLAEGRGGETNGTIGRCDMGGAGRQGQGNLRFEVSDLKDKLRGAEGCGKAVGESEGERRAGGNLRFEISDLKDKSRGAEGCRKAVGESEGCRKTVGDSEGVGRTEENLRFEISDLKCSEGDEFRRFDAGNVVERGHGQAGDGLNVDRTSENRGAENREIKHRTPENRVRSRLTGVDDWQSGADDRLTDVHDRQSGVDDRQTDVHDWQIGVDDRLTGVEDRLTGIKAGVEAGQGQNWNGDLNWKGRREWKPDAAVGSGTDLESERREAQSQQAPMIRSVARSGSSPSLNSDSRLNSKSSPLSDSTPVPNSNCDFQSNRQSSFDLRSNGEARPNAWKTSGNAKAVDGVEREQIRTHYPEGERSDANRFPGGRSGANCSGALGGDEMAGAHREGRAVAARAPYGFRARDKAEIVAGELLVGRGPVCGPVRIKPEALERNRRRNAARGGSRSP